VIRNPAPSPNDLDPIFLETSDHIDLQIRRQTPVPPKPKGHVVLIHGASAAFTTFVVPHGRSLSDELRKRDFDVWFLDWRGSHLVSGRYLDGTRASTYANQFRIDCVARIDIPEALNRIRELADADSLKVVAHCLGSGALAQSIAEGKLEGLKLSHVVFSTLGLFYEVTFDNAMKAKDYVLEKIRNPPGRPPCYFVAPNRGRWPEELQKDYDLWEQTLLPGCKPFTNTRLCRRLCFMYGIPYLHEQLADELHTAEALSEQFGPIPIEMYIQAGQNVRRRWAAPYGAPGDSDDYLSDKARKRFKDMRVTLITGTRNALWHRDSIDRMYEWLRRGAVLRGPETPARKGSGGTVEKIVFPEFGHQDLLWGKKAPEIVFPRIVDALTK